MSERRLSRLWRCEPVVARVAAIAVLVVAAAGWVAIVGVARGFWERTATFSGPETAAPSRLYGRPLRLRGGEMMTPERLADLLALHGYARAIRIEPRAGQFREIAPGEFAIVRRASPFEPPDPRADRLAISIARGRVTRLVEGGAERAELALDPALLATWLGADRADRRPAAFDELPPHLVRAEDGDDAGAVDWSADQGGGQDGQHQQDQRFGNRRTAARPVLGKRRHVERF